MPVAMGEARRTRRKPGQDDRLNGRARRAAGPSTSGASPVARTQGLSPAELDVVRALAEGLSPKEIARDRGTSIATVRTQIKRAKKKCAARTLNELVALVCMSDFALRPLPEPLASTE